MFGLATGWAWAIIAVLIVALFLLVDWIHHRLMKAKDTVPQELEDFRSWRVEEDDLWP